MGRWALSKLQTKYLNRFFALDLRWSSKFAQINWSFLFGVLFGSMYGLYSITMPHEPQDCIFVWCWLIIAKQSGLGSSKRNDPTKKLAVKHETKVFRE